MWSSHTNVKIQIINSEMNRCIESELITVEEQPECSERWVAGAEHETGETKHELSSKYREKIGALS